MKRNDPKPRIAGIDLARATAIIGMIIVNFKTVFGDKGAEWLKTLLGVFEGKAAALFVVLAGVGLALIMNSSIKDNNQVKIRVARKRIVKRALFLFIVGLSYISIWPADILHFYGIYMAITILVLTAKDKTIITSAVALIFAYPILTIFWNYEAGWNFDTLDYQDFWTIKGFLRNLFFNGFHPVIPWTAFMLFGYWFGKQNLHNERFIKRTFWMSSTIFISIQILSYLSITFLSEGNLKTSEELIEIIGTDPMPPLPFYMCNGIAIAFATISACILIAKRFQDSVIIDALNKTGQLALTFYVAHVIIGMGIVEAINPSNMGNYSIEFSVTYALEFSVLCILFAVIWRKYIKVGPLEWLMRKVTD